MQGCSLNIPGSKHCDSAHYDQLFVMINSTAAGDKRPKRAQVPIDEELVGRRGMASDAAGGNIDKRALCRHEWLNCLVRMAVMRYIMTEQEYDVRKR